MSQYEYHQALVTGIEFTESKSGNEQIVLEIDVLNNGNPTGTKRRIWLSCTPKAMEYTEAKLNRIGFRFESIDNFDWDADTPVDVSMKMKQRMDGDGEMEEWDIAPPASKPKPLSADKANRFSESMRVRFGGGGAPAKTSKKAPARKKAPSRSKKVEASGAPFDDVDGAWEWYKKSLGDMPDDFWKLVDEHGGEDNFNSESFYSAAIPL